MPTLHISFRISDGAGFEYLEPGSIGCLHHNVLNKLINLATAVSIVCVSASGCISRLNTSNLPQTLMGHWVTTRNDNEEVHRRFEKNGEAIYFNKTTDSLDRLPFKILNESPKARILRVETGLNGTVENIQFSDDGKSAEVWFEGLEDPDYRKTWRYVNNDASACR